MNGIRRAILLITLPTLAGCATQADLNSMQRDLEEMKSRLIQVDREFSDVKRSSKADIDKSIKAYQKDLEVLRKGTADAQAAIDATKVDSQVLAGKVEDLMLASKKPAEEVALLREDFERRIKAVEDRTAKMEKGLEDLQKKPNEAKAQETPEGLYQTALDFFRSGKYAKAREMFSRFIELYPKHSLAANSHYWLAETFYAEKDYDQAILEFQQIIENFSNKEKVPAAMFKQALAFKELGDVKSSRYVLKKLQNEYPFSEEAQKAKDKLKEMK